MLARGGWNVTQRDLERSFENNFPYGDFRMLDDDCKFSTQQVWISSFS